MAKDKIRLLEDTEFDMARRKLEILTRIGDAKKNMSSFHNQIRRWRGLYNFVRESEAKNANEVDYRDPVHTNTVDLAAAILLANKKDWIVKGFSPDPVEQEKSSSIEKLLAGLVDMASIDEEYDIDYEIVLNFVRDGVGALYTVWDDEKAAQSFRRVEVMDGKGNLEEATAYMDSPFHIEVIDPLEIYMIEGGRKRWRAIYREVEMSVYDVEVEFGVKIDRHAHLSESDKKNIKGFLTDYWELVKVTWQEPKKEISIVDSLRDLVSGKEKLPEVDPPKFQYVCENSLIFQGDFIGEPILMPEYKELPYTIGFYKPVSRKKSEEWGHNIMRPSESTVKLLERMIGRRAYQIDVYSDIPLTTITQPGRTVQLDPGMGRTASLQIGESIQFPQWPGNAPDIEEQLGFLRSRTQQSTFTEVMFGTGQSAGSGYALSQLGDQNRIRMEQPVRHLQLLWGMWAKKTLNLVEHFSPDSYVRVYGEKGGHSFSEQMKGKGISDFRVFCKIKPEFPNEKSRNHAMATQVKGILSNRTIGEQYLGIGQMDDELDQLLEEQMLQNPMIRQLTILQQIKAMADADDKVAQFLWEELQRTGIPQQAGEQAKPRNMEQLTGTASPDGSTTPQEQGNLPPGQSALEDQQRQATQKPEMVP